MIYTGGILGSLSPPFNAMNNDLFHSIENARKKILRQGPEDLMERAVCVESHIRELLSSGGYQEILKSAMSFHDGKNRREESFHATEQEESFHLSALDLLLVVEPHPDDAVLGAFGLMNTVLTERKHCHVVTMVSGANAVAPSFLKGKTGHDVIPWQETMRSRFFNAKPFLPTLCQKKLRHVMEQHFNGVAFKKARVRYAESLQAFKQACPSQECFAHTFLDTLGYYSELDLNADERQSLDEAVVMFFIKECFQKKPRQIWIVLDLGEDPAGRHLSASQVFLRALKRVLQELSSPSIRFLFTEGVWGMSRATKERLGVDAGLGVLMSEEMFEAQVKAFLAHRSQLIPAQESETSLTFVERMILRQYQNFQQVLSKERVVRYLKNETPVLPLLDFYYIKDFKTATGGFDKKKFMEFEL